MQQITQRYSTFKDILDSALLGAKRMTDWGDEATGKEVSIKRWGEKYERVREYEVEREAHMENYGNWKRANEM